MIRRGFLQNLIAGAVALAAGVVPYGISVMLAPGRAAPPRNYLRPPGALAGNAAFVAACIGCGLCGEVCPHPSKPIWIVDRTDEAIRERGA